MAWNIRQSFSHSAYFHGCSRCVSVTLMVKVEETTKPESKPAGDGGLVVLSAARYVQGAANDD